MSIFDKDCPLCGSELPVSADGCACGFSFEPNSLEETAQELELAAQDEKLYANYLSARVAQTKEAIESVKIVLEREPERQDLLNDLKNAESEHEAALSEFKAQNEKLAAATSKADAAKESLNKARAVFESQKAEVKAKAEAESKREAEEARLRAAARAQAARDKAAKEQERAKRLADKEAKIIKRQAEALLKKDEEKLSKQAKRAAKAAHERQVAMAMALVSRADDDIKQAKRYTSTNKNTDTVDEVKKESITNVTTADKQPETKVQASVVVSSTVAKKSKSPARKKTEFDKGLESALRELEQETATKTPVITKKPDLVFKARQAIKAAAAIMSKSEKKNTEQQSAAIKNKKQSKINSGQQESNVTVISEKVVKQATPEFKSKQRRNTDRLAPLPKLVHNAGPTCPHCTAEIDTSAEKCKCGFVLEPTSPDGLELVLSDADKEAMEAFSYISITKMS